jgi:hypothetical protein
MIGDDVTNHPRSRWQARLARLRKAWMMEELQGGIGGLDPPKIITTYKKCGYIMTYVWL